MTPIGRIVCSLLLAIAGVLVAIFAAISVAVPQTVDVLSLQLQEFVFDERRTAMVPNNEMFCVPWESDFDVDEWWLHHYEWEESHDNTNDTHSCFTRIKDPARLSFYRRVHQVQWNGDCAKCRQSIIKNSGFGTAVGEQVSGFYMTMVRWKLTLPFQMTKHWYGHKWLYATEDNSSWAYCESMDLKCYVLPLSDCKPFFDFENRTRWMPPRPPNTGFLNTSEFSWIRQYTTRYRKKVRKRVYDTLRNEYPKVDLPCTAIHVRRGDVGLPRRPFRRYAAVSEYLELGQVRPGENIVLLTDDDTTIREVQRFYPQYNWFYPNRTRHTAAHGGFSGHIPSNDEGHEFVQILAELRLASKCSKFVHGWSSFHKVVLEAMADAGTRATTYFLDTRVPKEVMRLQPRGSAFGDQMIKSIEEKTLRGVGNRTPFDHSLQR